jgi:hypothetical protein
MAKNIRAGSSGTRMNEQAASLALVDECNRQVSNCLHTATSFTIWLRTLRWLRVMGQIVPAACGALAMWSILRGYSVGDSAFLVVIVTVVSPIILASKIEKAIEEYEKLAGEFTNLRDRFRQLANISSLKPFVDFEADVQPVFKRMEEARARQLAPPDWCFKWAVKKINAGDYGVGKDTQLVK